jgi:hypothetical protein
MSNGESGETNRIVDRPIYYAGKVLTADDLRLEQDYRRDREWAHNRLHGWGVVSGLSVEATRPGSSRVVVRPGSALDGYGREIVLTAATLVDVSSLIASRRPGCVYVTIEYGEEGIDSVPALGVDEEDGPMPGRIREVPTVTVVGRRDDQGPSLVLAKIELLPGAKSITARRIDNSVRRRVGPQPASPPDS